MKRFRNQLAGLAVFALFLLVLALKFDVLAKGTNIYDQIQRFVEVMQAVSKLYVEEVDPGQLVDGAINGMLEKLDPHTVYIPKERLQEISEQFEGEFEGIGIEFIVHDKVPMVVSPIAGSPSERLGLRPGDRIVKIEGVSTYGMTEQQIRQKLLGPKGSQVTIQIQRPGLEEPFDVTITRDKIPVYSITVSFMLDDKTGYIKVGRFARTTDEEFENALQELEGQGMKQLILDLRGNSGGYLEQAVEMADKFLDGGKRIVYTRGRIPNSNEDYYSTDEGTHPKYPLIVLIDHGSASASEIVAGAIQDWDRGLIMGVTSFGKGLVQNQISLRDGSAVRITIARYYTPSGRLIQRPYKNGLQDYISEAYDDYDPNSSPDSTAKKPVFKTSSGRKVYGGGGISPDIRLPLHRLSRSTVRLIQNQILFDYAQDFAARHDSLAADFDGFKKRFVVDAKMVGDAVALARRRGVEVDEKEIAGDGEFIKRRIKSQIARHLWGAKEFYEIEVLEDGQVREAVKYFNEAAKLANLTLER
ncbi:MAG: S41 family peptidase [Calditrichaeota bacterium]|nr:MAG: S41 family peptidase [Calditrichota bacterium]